MNPIISFSPSSSSAVAVVSTTPEARPVANFPRNVWGSCFLSHIPEDPNLQSAKELSRDLLIQSSKVEILQHELAGDHDKKRKLQLIDTIQRLGIEYHFQGEIDQALQDLRANYDHHDHKNDDLCTLALTFRLLRQHGHKISTEVFDKFKDDKGYFNASVSTTGDEVVGLLELYEATYLSIQGEEILDHVRAFARAHLESILLSLCINPRLKEQVSYALNKHSNRRGMPRLEARRFISIYEQMDSPNENLLKLAKIDYNLLQSIHKTELSELCWWWKGLNLAEKLPYIRDRMVECYFNWSLGVYFKSQYSLARKILAKVIALLSAIDDTYDAYGTYEELEIFTEAFERWSITCLDSLPEYMKVLYMAILEVFEEIEDELNNQGRSYRLYYGKEAVKEIVRAYFAEAKWLHNKHTPTMKEYMEVALMSAGFKTMTTLTFLIGDDATKEAFDWVLGFPDMVKAISIIGRLQADIVGHEFERERNHIPSSIECYMKEHGVSKTEAVNELNSRIEDAWKDVNEGFLKPTKVAEPLLYCIINLARVMEVMYKKSDGYTHVCPEKKRYIEQALVDPIPE